MTQPTQAQIAHVIWNRIANGLDVSEKQKAELLEFIGLPAAAAKPSAEKFRRRLRAKARRAANAVNDPILRNVAYHSILEHFYKLPRKRKRS